MKECSAVPPVIVWLRQNDFRLHDNQALSHASSLEKPVLVVYIHDSLYQGPSKVGSASAVWLEHTLKHFSEELIENGFSWSLRTGSPINVIQEIIKETKATEIFWNRRYEPDLLQVDKEVKETLRKKGMTVESFQGNILIEPFSFYNKSLKPYQVFTQFFKSLYLPLIQKKNTPTISPLKIKFSQPIHSLKIEDLQLTPRHLDWCQKVISTWSPGEHNALKTLDIFTKELLSTYSVSRNIPSKIATSCLSPHLHFGEISIRFAWDRILHSLPLADTSLLQDTDPRTQFLKELAWREFNMHLLYHFPKTVTMPLRHEFERFPFRKDRVELNAWKKGLTGIPIVDAGMRQLWQTGWMHNRIRMVVASFLVKHLLHSWEEGTSWFHNTLFDADLASNTMNWQWVSGCGADAAPYFRIFNPVLQGEKFDPDGTYVKKYIPELTSIPPKYIHKPWEATQENLRSWGIALGHNYPFPIINLDIGRKRALEAFSTIISKDQSAEKADTV